MQTFRFIGEPVPVLILGGRRYVRAEEVANRFGFDAVFRRRFRRLMSSDLVPVEQLFSWLLRVQPRRVTPMVRRLHGRWQEEAFRVLGADPGVQAMASELLAVLAP